MRRAQLRSTRIPHATLPTSGKSPPAIARRGRRCRASARKPPARSGASRETYLRGGLFDKDAMLTLIQETLRQAENWASLLRAWLPTPRPPSTTGPASANEWVEYE